MVVRPVAQRTLAPADRRGQLTFLSDAMEPTGSVAAGAGAASPALAVPRDFLWVTDLGKPLIVGRAGRSALVILGPVLIGAGLLLGILLAAWVGEDLLHLHDMALFVFALPIVALTLALLGYWFGARLGKAAIVFEDGVAFRDSTRIRAWRWSDLRAVRVSRKKVEPEIPTEAPGAAIILGLMAFMKVFKIKRKEVIEYEITARDRTGATWTIDSWFPNSRQLGDHIEAEVTREVAPGLIEAFEMGEWVAFGPISVHRADGLKVGSKAAPWREIDHLEIKDGILKVKLTPKRDLASVGLDLIENVRVLLPIAVDAITRFRS